ncbi:N-benzyl-3-pyrrolidinol dehydrogenase [Pilatotrama ljubarskyi]|nr:N-benzyl-3-pyrrolidinol dehydrogenase [Pilatotrama ljubarskyi]
MTSTMKAAVYHPGNNELVLEDVPVPTPGPKEVLVKIAASGVCHSDTFLLSAAIPDNRSYILGHENVGYAVQIGCEVEGIVKGGLYAIHDLVPCVAMNNLPPALNSIGIGRDGGYAEYIVVNAEELVPVPDGLAPEVAAVASDALLTAYNAVHNVAQLGPGTTKRVLIYGVGGLGHLAVQLAKYFGATVYACDYKPAARDLAVSLGAERALDTLELTNETAAGTFTVDVVIDFVSNEQSFTLGKAAVKGDAFDATAPTGLIVLVGFTADQLPLSSLDLILYRTNVLSVLYGTIDDMKTCLDLLAKGIVKPVVTTEPLANVNKVLDELKASEVTGRKVIIPSLAN